MIKLRKKVVTESEAKKAGKKSKRAAIRKSEEKWEAIVSRHLEGWSEDKILSIRINWSTCALCQRYPSCNDRYSCPLVKVSGGHCEKPGSAYKEYVYNRNTHNALKMLNIIRKAAGKKRLPLTELKKIYSK